MTPACNYWLSALSRRRWLGIAGFVAPFAIAFIYYAAAARTFEARTKLLVEFQTPQVVSFKDVLEPNAEKVDYYETQIEMIRSRTLARHTIEALALWDDPELTDGGAAPSQLRVVDAFLKRVTVTYRPDNRVFEVGYRSANPQHAANVANALARQYIQRMLDLKLQAAKQASTFLTQRLDEQRRQVEASERALQAYREKNPGLRPMDHPPTPDVTAQKAAELGLASARAKAVRIEAQTLYAQAQAAAQDPKAIETLPMVMANPFIQQLKAELSNLQREQSKLSDLGDRHPDLVKNRAAIARIDLQLRTEMAKITAAAQNQLAAAQIAERQLADSVQAQARQDASFDHGTAEYTVLQREVLSHRQIYDALLERAKETEIASQLPATNVHVVDPAEVPEIPRWPRLWILSALALLLAAPLAVGLVVGAEYVDDRIESPEAITANLGMRVLGVSPIVPEAARKALVPLVTNGVPSGFSEALRTVRANLLMSATSDSPQSVLVTSTRPGEGKTIVAANLGLALASAGRRVLLVDADMRQGRLDQLFGLEATEGLADVLQRRIPVADAIRETGTRGLSLITAGTAQEASADLLELPILSDALNAIRDRFDWIILDSPPVMAAADPISLAQIANTVVFVVGAHMTSLAEARAAIGLLGAAQSKIVGAVLSRADIRRCAPYYGYYVPRAARLAS